jgi:hypothetical protein
MGRGGRPMKAGDSGFADDLFLIWLVTRADQFSHGALDVKCRPANV